MCNNYALKVSWTAFLDAFASEGLHLQAPQGAPNLPPLENIWPTDTVPLIRPMADQPEGQLELVQMKWGFAPPRPKAGPIINFRSEGRRFGPGRCLAPASHFYEYTGAGSPKTKWKFSSTIDDWFCIAAIWRPAHATSTGDYPASFSLLTLEPGPDVADLHHRQIAILERQQWKDWLNPQIPAERILRSSPPGTLQREQVRPT